MVVEEDGARVDFVFDAVKVDDGIVRETEVVQSVLAETELGVIWLDWMFEHVFDALLFAVVKEVDVTSVRVDVNVKRIGFSSSLLINILQKASKLDHWLWLIINMLILKVNK